MSKFQLVSPFQPAGDQPKAIEQMMAGLKRKEKHQTLLGVTGSGKTFSMANVIQKIQRPTLILAHNKTLAAQLCSEFREFFPNNAVCYFVSYYDYYQPEAYMAASDTYIEKDASINDEIDKYRHFSTQSLLTRNDVIIVASVSCIYGLGPVEDYKGLAITLKKGETIQRDQLLRQLTDIQFSRSHLEFKQGMFHVLGDSIEIFPSSQDTIFKLDFWGDEIESIHECDPFTGEVHKELDSIHVFPAKHNVTTEEKIKKAVEKIRVEKEHQVKYFRDIGKILEAERINTRTEFDIEMLLETGYVSGIENYVRYFGDRESGQQPATLLDYFPDESLFFIDESHISIPQIGGMFGGNKSRKDNLINHGFRLPSAYDNRPLNFEEFETHVNQAIYVSATPGKYEYANTDKKNIVEQIIRPTGLLDPVVEVRDKKHQVDDLMNEIQIRLKRNERVLVTTLTKKQAEDLTEFLKEANLNVRYLHSDVDTMERIEVLRQLRAGEIDIVVGINLLREGLDLPEVSLVAILDADKEGFLRSRDALIQTIGRTARNVKGLAILYTRVSTEKDKELGHNRNEDGLHLTKAMTLALEETNRRREIQQAHNEKHGITPQSIIKAVNSIVDEEKKALDEAKKAKAAYLKKVPKEEIPRMIHHLEQQMQIESENMNFEKAGELRDEIEQLQVKLNK
jgi:excinuclease ABC subunit B